MSAKLHAQEQKGSVEPLTAAMCSFDLVKRRIKKLLNTACIYSLLLMLPNMKSTLVLVPHAVYFASLCCLNVTRQK